MHSISAQHCWVMDMFEQAAATHAAAQGSCCSRHPLCCAGELPWETPTLEHYEELQAESEFAAWVLVNGYSLSHATISVHRTGIK
jgi:Domain of unknown function (DUF1338)